MAPGRLYARTAITGFSRTNSTAGRSSAVRIQVRAFTPNSTRPFIVNMDNAQQEITLMPIVPDRFSASMISRWDAVNCPVRFSHQGQTWVSSTIN